MNTISFFKTFQVFKTWKVYESGIKKADFSAFFIICRFLFFFLYRRFVISKLYHN
jgi:hypothetical protein